MKVKRATWHRKKHCKKFFLTTNESSLFQLAEFANGDMLATVLEEMPPFPERESSILAKLKKKKPGAAKVIEDTDEKKTTPKAAPGKFFFRFLNC